MLQLAIDALARRIRLDRSRSMRRRLRKAERRISTLADGARTSPRGGFELEPWRYSVPLTLLVSMAAERGFVPDDASRGRHGRGDAAWELRERIHFVPGALGAA